ncbi:MAG: hypothetical protein ACREWG_00650 [Gammaproteobacteria bacterium]
MAAEITQAGRQAFVVEGEFSTLSGVDAVGAALAEEAGATL